MFRRSWDEPPSSTITPPRVYQSRRAWMGATGALALAGVAAAATRATATAPVLHAPPTNYEALTSELGEEVTPEAYATRYNNFYEFGTGKDDPAKYASALTIDPWHVEVKGEVGKPGTYALDDLLRDCPVEDRVYRLRCVEAWSMVIPWQGVELAGVLKKLEPTSAAKFVRFTTLERRSEMRGMRSVFSSIDWPYVEGLRLDEAMHPLTLLATGMYGNDLPKQNGAPLRLVVPWKYGFKSIKSIVKIELLKRAPRSTWQRLAPSEYGFYANVNPAVSHPRWSQASERRLPSSLFNSKRRDTLPFNGYGEQVAGLYAGMDLRRNY